MPADRSNGWSSAPVVRSEQIIYVLAGKGEMMIEAPNGTPEKTAIRPGSLVYIPRGAYHSTFTTG